MKLSDLWDTLRTVLGQATAKPASPAPKAAAPMPAPPRPAAAPVPPRPAPAPVPAAGSQAASGGGAPGSATLVRAVRAGGRTLTAGTVVKVVAVHGKGTAYTVQVPGLATSKTIEGAAVRVG